MKRYYIAFLICSLLVNAGIGQVPQSMNYQAVARDNAGAILAGQSIALRFTIHDGASAGPSVYSERQTTVTNSFGLFTCIVGTGTLLSGVFDSIKWGTGDKYLQVEMDAVGGTGYVDMGTSQLVSVPYALYAGNGGTQGPTGPQGPAGSCDFIKAGDGKAVVYNADNAYGFGSSTSDYSAWYTTALSGGNVKGAIASDSNIVIYTSTTAYGFGNSASGYSTWHSKALTDTVIGVMACSGKVVVYTASNAYGFGPSTGGNSTWYSTALTGIPIGIAGSGNRIVLYTSSNAYGFGNSTGGYSAWYPKALSSSPTGVITTR